VALTTAATVTADSLTVLLLLTTPTQTTTLRKPHTHCSVGNVVDPFQLASRYGVDPTRYFLLTEMPFGSDGDYSDPALVLRCNSNLANELGNLAQRTLSLAFRNCGEQVPQPAELLEEVDTQLLSAAAGTLAECRQICEESQRLDLYCKAVLVLVQVRLQSLCACLL
jgi:methionyl-tRNA synthetase